jgi:dimethylhistidine N-methyltransferase
LYDKEGSQLFDRICETPEYYPTRTELAITERYAGEMADVLGPDVLLIEFGSGSSLKTRILLAALKKPAAYVPVDISREHLAVTSTELDADFPSLPVLPVCGDFMQPFELPEPPRREARRVVYFPGSTIGNLTADQSRKCLHMIAKLVGAGGGMLIGIDLQKDIQTLEAAYNDALGVTATFSLNLLRRVNRELDADFDVNRFKHRAVYNEGLGRVEIELVSMDHQIVKVDGQAFEFFENEGIHTEYSHKYTLPGFAQLAAPAGLTVEKIWMDDKYLFSVLYFVANRDAVA